MSKEIQDETEFAGLFELDQYSLDREWVDQPKLYFKYATLLAKAKGEHDRAKANREVVIAELDKAIRNDPQVFNLSKVTEGAVEKCILLQKAYQIVNDLVLQGKHKVDMLDALVNALDHRKKALENLVFLHGQSYFASPRPPQASKEKLDEVVKKAAREKGKRALNER